MNTYYLRANAMYVVEYTVEAANEDDAINEVEYGNVEPDSAEFDGEVHDVEVIDVEYGDTEYSADLSVTFVVRGVKDHGNVKDALWDILQTFDGKTTKCDTDGELELVGFNVNAVNEE